MCSSLYSISLGLSELPGFLGVYFLCSWAFRLVKWSFIIFSNKFSIFCPSPSPSGTPVIQMLEFKVVPEVPQPLLISLNSCFFILFWLNVYFSFLVQIVDWSLDFLSATAGSLYIFVISLCTAFTSSSILRQYPTISVSILITSVLNSSSDRFAISLLAICLLPSVFSGVLICSFIWAIFLCLGRTLGIHQDREPTSLLCGGVCGGWTREGTMPHFQLSPHFQSPPPFPTSKLGSFGADSRWVGLCMF